MIKETLDTLVLQVHQVLLVFQTMLVNEVIQDQLEAMDFKD